MVKEFKNYQLCVHKLGSPRIPKKKRENERKIQKIAARIKLSELKS
jgi:hypothetical protein